MPETPERPETGRIEFDGTRRDVHERQLGHVSTREGRYAKRSRALVTAGLQVASPRLKDSFLQALRQLGDLALASPFNVTDEDIDTLLGPFGVLDVVEDEWDASNE